MTSNWTIYGLVNGANGYIRDILFDENQTLPHTVFVEFKREKLDSDQSTHQI